MNLVEQHLVPCSVHLAFWAKAIKVLKMSSFPPRLWLMDENGFMLVFSLLSSHKSGSMHLNSKMEENLWLGLTFFITRKELWCNLKINFCAILTEKSIRWLLMFGNWSRVWNQGILYTFFYLDCHSFCWNLLSYFLCRRDFLPP